jgi:hypothetical protein
MNDRYCRRKKSESENNKEEDGKRCKERDVILEIDQEYADKLEESLEKVYIKLLKSKRYQYII